MTLLFRPAEPRDIPAMAEIRAGDWADAAYWEPRIRAYLSGESRPQHALAPRVAFVCADADQVVGLIAGHLTRRFGCDGELQWLSICPQYRRRGVAAQLWRALAEWFVAKGAFKICVDVEPSNTNARSFYRSQGAVEFKPSWMVWKDVRTGLLNVG